MKTLIFPTLKLVLTFYFLAPEKSFGDGEWRVSPNKTLVRADRFQQQKLTLRARKGQATSSFSIRLTKEDLAWNLVDSKEGILALSNYFAPATVVPKITDTQQRIYIIFLPELLKHHGGWVEEGYTFFIGQRIRKQVHGQTSASKHAPSTDDQSQNTPLFSGRKRQRGENLAMDNRSLVDKRAQRTYSGDTDANASADIEAEVSVNISPKKKGRVTTTVKQTTKVVATGQRGNMCEDKLASDLDEEQEVAYPLSRANSKGHSISDSDMDSDMDY